VKVASSCGYLHNFASLGCLVYLLYTRDVCHVALFLNERYFKISIDNVLEEHLS